LKSGFFIADSYDTRKDKQRVLLDRLMLNTRFYFLSKYAAIVLRSRSVALRGRYDTQAWASSSYEVFNLVESCGGRFHLTGLENLRECKGPVVFISNHMSTLETMIFPCLISPLMEVTFVVKESLVSHPFLGPVMRSRNPIVVNRTNSKEDFQTVMNKGQELLRNGTSIIVFPQSTRKVEFIPEEFNSLGVKLASKAKVQVVPVAIKTDFWENGKYLKDLGPINRTKPIYMAFGKPISVDGNGKEENKKIIEFISAHLQKWNQ